jgi:hypothetical protein
MGRGQGKNTPLECMVKNFKRGYNGDYGVKLTLNKLKVLCEVDWPAFDVRWPQERSLNKTVVSDISRVIVKKKVAPRRMEKAKRLKLVFKKQSFGYLNSGSYLLGGLRRNQSLSISMDSFGVPVCTSSPKMSILKED